MSLLLAARRRARSSLRAIAQGGHAVAAALILSACGSGDEQPQQVHEEPLANKAENASATVDVRILKNGDLTPGLNVRFQPFDSPRLDELRVRENLEAVVASGRDEFEKILVLKDWVASQWPQGVPNPYPPWDAIVILDWIRNGVTGGFCAQYAQVLLQSLAALGLTARYVELGSVDNPYAHFVTEVWSNQFNKWVVLDADYNVHFERDGVPLSALEVHDALVQSKVSELVVVQGPLRRGHSDPARWPHRTAELYYYVRLHLKADHLSVPDEPPFDRFNDMVDWRDELTVMWEDSQVPSPYPKERLTNIQSDERAAFANALNQVRVTVEPTGQSEVLLTFENNVFQFQHYQIRELHSLTGAGEWRDLQGHSFLWRPSLASWKLEVRGVNIRGIPGPPSVVSARVKRSGPL